MQLLGRPHENARDTLLFYSREALEMSDMLKNMPPTPPRPTPIFSPTTEEELLRFIREQRDDRVGERLRELFEAYMEHDKKDVERHEELVGTIKGHSLRIAQLEKDSGTFEAELSHAEKTKITELTQREEWRRRFFATTIVGVGISIISGAIGVIVTMLLRK